MGCSEKARQVGTLEAVLVAEEVLIVLREVAATDPLSRAVGRRENEGLPRARHVRGDEAAREIGRRDVERRLLERDRRVWGNRVVVLVVVEASLEREFGCRRKE